MLANWIKQYTSTTGTGTITLGAKFDNSFVTIADSYFDGELVHYQIKDGLNRESGIGTYTATGNTLSRDIILETLVSGVLSTSSPTAISLTGNAIVSVSASSSSQFVTLPGTYGAGYGITSKHLPSNLDGSVTLTADRLYALPFWLDRPVTSTKLRIDVNTAQASSNIRVGLALVDKDWKPGNLLREGSVIDSSVSGPVSSDIASIDLRPGWYFTLLVCNNSSLNVAACGRAGINGGPLGAGTSGGAIFQKNYLFGTYTYGALPSNASSTITNSDDGSNFPAIQIVSS